MILVAGATGVLGSEIVERLRARGESVRALVRASSSRERVARLERAGADIVVGDLRDPASLDAACRGAGAVICTVSMIVTAQPGDSFSDTDEAGVIALIDAARRAGASRFVHVSFDHEHTPESPLVHAKRSAEAHLRASGLTYTILHPGLFMESWLGPVLFADPATGSAKIYGDGDDKLRYVAVTDVAEAAVQSLTDPEANNAVVSVLGPEGVSQREAVRLFEEAFGRRFDVSAIPVAALEAQWQQAADPFQRSFASLMLGVARGQLGAGDPPPSPSFRLGGVTVREWVERAARG